MTPEALGDEAAKRAIEGDIQLEPDAAPQDDFKQLMVRAKPLLEPALAEILSEPTRKTQRELLTVAFVVVLVSAGAVTFAGTAKVGGADLNVNPMTIVTALFAVCAYLEVLVAIRCFTDWKIYRLKTGINELDLAVLADEVASRERALAGERGADRRPRDETEEAGRLRSERGWGKETEDADVRRARNSDGIRRAQEALEALRQARDEHRMRAQMFEKRASWFRREFRAANISKLTRLAWEVLFPLLFGGFALVIAGQMIRGKG
jgi:hypothetical protein